MNALPAAPLPAPDSRPVLRVLKIRPGSTYTHVILSPEFLGYICHFKDKRTIPCRAAHGYCLCLEHNVDQRWMGYVVVSPKTHLSPMLHPLTEGGIQNCAALQSLNGQLRGKILVAKRLGQSPTSPVQYTLFPPELSEQQIVKLPDVPLRAALARMWRCPEIEADAEPTDQAGRR